MHKHIKYLTLQILESFNLLYFDTNINFNKRIYLFSKFYKNIKLKLSKTSHKFIPTKL